MKNTPKKPGLLLPRTAIAPLVLFFLYVPSLFVLADDPTVSKAKVTLVSLEANNAHDVMKLITPTGTVKICAATQHTGILSVDPPSERANVQVRLVQMVNGNMTTSPAVAFANNPLSGPDTAYASMAQNVTMVGDNQIKVTSEDEPGPEASAGVWRFNLNPDQHGTFTWGFTANLYIQYRIGNGDWKCAGMLTWGAHKSGIFSRGDDGGVNVGFGSGTGVTTGSGTIFTGTPSTPPAP